MSGDSRWLLFIAIVISCASWANHYYLRRDGYRRFSGTMGIPHWVQTWRRGAPLSPTEQVVAVVAASLAAIPALLLLSAPFLWTGRLQGWF